MANKGYMAKVGLDTSDVDKKIRSLNTELKTIDKSLEENGESALYTSQKYTALGEQIQAYENKLQTLVNAQQRMRDALADGVIQSSDMRSYEREVDKTAQTLEELRKKYGEMTKEESDAEKQLRELTEEYNDNAEAAKNAGEQTNMFGEVLAANLSAAVIEKGVELLKKLGDQTVQLIQDAAAAYGQYQQLVGGVETLFSGAEDIVSENAKKAFETAGISANSYMKQITSFAASMVNALEGDTVEAAKLADQAIRDMSDNANKMGTDLQSIQNAYQGFAKQNYTMLDNLKLGYGGTKTEMKRLIDDANAVKEAMGETADLSIERFSDVTEAIHIVQQQLGITGTTAEEAAKTIEGSAGAAQAAWENLVVGLADPTADLSKLIDNFINSKITEINNLLPTVEHTIEGISNAIDSLFKEISNSDSAVSQAIGQITESSEKILKTVAENLTKAAPMLVDGALTLAETLINGIADGIDEYLPVFIDVVGKIAETLVNHTGDIVLAGEKLILALIDGLIQNLPKLLIQAAVLIGEIAGQLVKTLDESEKEFGDIGGDIFAYIREGIYTAITDTDWTEVSKRIAENWLQADFDHIDSFEEIGVKMFQGIVKGLDIASKLGIGSSNPVFAFANAAIDDLLNTRHGGGGLGGKRIKDEADNIDKASKKYVETVDYAAQRQQQAYKKYLQTQHWDTSDEALESQEKYWDNIFHYDKKNQEEYWQQRRDYLDTHRSNTEAFWNAWNETEKHFADKAEKERKDAETERTKKEKEAADAEKKHLQELKKGIDDAFYELEIEKTAEGKDTGWLLEQQRKYIDALDKSSDLYREYDKKWRKDWADWEQKQAEEEKKRIKEAQEKAEKDTKAWTDYAEKRADAQQKAIEQIEKSEQKTAESYMKRVNTFTKVTDTQGKERLIIGDVKEKIKELETYEKNINKLKDMDLPDGMLEDILNMGFDERVLYVKELLRMSANQREKYFSQYAKYRATAQRVAHSEYEDDYTQAAADAAQATADIWAQMPENATEEGRKAAQAYIDGYTEYMRENGHMDALNAAQFGAVNFAARNGANAVSGNLVVNVAGKQAIQIALKEIFTTMKNAGAVLDV